MQFLGEALIWAAEDLWALILHITGRSSFPKPLCAAEEAEYIRRMGEGDASARDALIEHDLRLVAHIAKKYQGGAPHRAAGRPHRHGQGRQRSAPDRPARHGQKRGQRRR